MNQFQEASCATQNHWLTGSIRRKLTLFVMVILLLVVGLFWFVSIYMLQPSYEYSIRKDLRSLMGSVVSVLDDAYAKGELSVVAQRGADGSVSLRLGEVCLERLQEAENSGKLVLGTRCVEISNQALQNVHLSDGLWPRCLLHPSSEQGITADGEISMPSERNGTMAQLIRRQVFSAGSYEWTLEGGQMVMGTTAAEGTLAVVVSANTERIPQAVGVLKGLLWPVTMILVAISLLAALVFSRWFTRPLSRLSAATREMARGNYDVQVETHSNDEIGELARDFNAMATEVKRSADLQRDLIANVSHDLRTPLTLIKGYAETVRDLSGDDPEKRTEQLNVIVDEADRLSALVGSVMELSRVSSGNERPEPMRFDLGQLCDELADRYGEWCRQRGYRFEFFGEEDCEVYADPALLERALRNLLGNAINHVGDDGFIGLKVFKTEHSTVRVEVADHGPGITAEDMPHLFERYYRSRADTGKPGTGLGLSIVKAIFVAHGFTYGVESQPGAGATFWFEARLV
ncbi:MAG: sensor histidine kinase [Oscillospiraceae bacterium]